MASPVSYEVIRHCIKTRAVGFGEEHDKGTARELLATWIQKGIVKDIVLELGEPWETHGVLGKKYLAAVKHLDDQWKNSYSLSKLIEFAANNDVRVHCWDPGDKSSVAMDQNIANRNSAIATKFQKHFTGGGFAVTRAPNCVVLMGISHFGTGHKPLDHLLSGLHWIKII